MTQAAAEHLREEACAKSPPSGESPGLVANLRERAANQPADRAFTFLANGGEKEVPLRYGELDRRARAIGAALQMLGASGERALLVHPPGLEFICAFLGCLYAGVVAVPVYPPDIRRPAPSLPRLTSIAEDSGAAIVLTTQALTRLRLDLTTAAPRLGMLRWLATDREFADSEDAWTAPQIAPETLAFLQYTSGSTSAPKGVMVSHGNLMDNVRLIRDTFDLGKDRDLGVSWLPSYHDMGLIGGALTPLAIGAHSFILSPLAFLRRPIRWLREISQRGATVSAGPNFAYDLCVRRTTPEERRELDLSRWRIAFCGAEPVRPETLEAFCATFAKSRFDPEAFVPCYGLAESTLIVTGRVGGPPPTIASFERPALERGRAVPASDARAAALSLVGCGRPLGAQRVVIVDPATRKPCGPGRVGEIWVSGPSVALGYWGRPVESEGAFAAELDGGTRRRFLRTGDLGFLHRGELFVTGRMKDLIILHGRNIAPQDVERAVERRCPQVRPDGGAAFPIERDGQECLVVVFESELRGREGVNEVVEAIRVALAQECGLVPHAVVLIEPHTLPKTSSGKVRRFACRDAYLRGQLNVLGDKDAHPA
jgi:acyl-CoA synthetase (AMP-forming)/AMP-acid ligase II